MIVWRGRLGGTAGSEYAFGTFCALSCHFSSVDGIVTKVEDAREVLASSGYDELLKRCILG